MRNADRFANGIELKDMIVYAFVSFASNYVGFIVYIVTTMMFIKGKVTPTYTSLIVFEIIPILAAAALTFLYFKKAVPEQHLDNESRRSWQNNGLWLILPGEIARYLVTLLDLGDCDRTGRIALAPSMLFEQTYIKPLTRLKGVTPCTTIPTLPAASPSPTCSSMRWSHAARTLSALFPPSRST